LIAQLIKHLHKDTDPVLLADLVISHIESALPEILERLELPAKMSAEKRYIEQARLRGTGFRQSSKTARRLIAARLNQESKLDAIRQVREQIRTTVQLTSKGSTSSESPAQEVFTRGSGALWTPSTSIGDFTEIFLPVGSSPTSRPSEPNVLKDVSITDTRDSDDSHLEKRAPVPRLAGLDARGKFAVIQKGRLIDLADSKLSPHKLPRGTQQIQVPNEELYRNLDSVSLLASYNRTARSRASSNRSLSHASEMKLMEAMLAGLELEEQWSIINRRRFHLITKRYKAGLREDEAKELERLQELARERANMVAPLPFSTMELLRDYAQRAGLLDQE